MTPTNAAAVPAETRQAIEALIHEHAWLIDHGAANRVPTLFTGDARLIGLGSDRIGRDAITAWALARAAMSDRTSRHVQTNIRIEPGSGGTMRGTVVLTVYRHDGPGLGSSAPLLIGEYEDIYAQGADGAWRIAERRLTVLFGTP